MALDGSGWPWMVALVLDGWLAGSLRLAALALVTSFLSNIHLLDQNC